MDTTGRSSPSQLAPQHSHVKTEPTDITPTGSSVAPTFKKVRSYLRTIQQREALGGFMKAGWSPAELAEFSRQIYLAPGKNHPPAASYRYAIEKGADHPSAVETLASLRNHHPITKLS